MREGDESDPTDTTGSLPMDEISEGPRPVPGSELLVAVSASTSMRCKFLVVLGERENRLLVPSMSFEYA